MKAQELMTANPSCCTPNDSAERAARLLDMLSPVSHGRTPDEVSTYQVEPYVIAADVYGVAPHVGRGGWTWYTGSAGWMYRTVLESLLGFTLRGGKALVLRPCLPRAWPGFTLVYLLSDERTAYRIEVRRAADGEETVAWLDGEPIAEQGGELVFPLAYDGREHGITLVLGAHPATRYVPAQ
jgi:N,N'-diacetylchitobiose phosphorylase